MCPPTSDEQIGVIDKESRNHQQEAAAMYTNQFVQAEVSYRQERLARDFHRFDRNSGTGGRRTHRFFHLLGRHSG